MPKHHHSVSGPNVEVADPQLFIDERNERGEFQSPRFWNFEVESAGDMDRLNFGEPCKGDCILGPAASDRDRNFILLAAVEGPMIERSDPLNDVYGVFGAIEVNLQKRHSMAFEDEYPANSSTRLRLDTGGGGVPPRHFETKDPMGPPSERFADWARAKSTK